MTYDTQANILDLKKYLTGLRDRQFGDQAQMYVGCHLAIMPRAANYKTVYLTPVGVACRLAELASSGKPGIISRIDPDSQTLYYQSKNAPHYSCYDECRTIFYSKTGNLGKDYWAPFQSIAILSDVFGLPMKFWVEIEQFRMDAHNKLTLAGHSDECYFCFDNTIKLLNTYIKLDSSCPLDQIFWDQI